MKYLIYARVSPKGSSWACSETTISDQVAQCESYVKVRDEEAEIVQIVKDEFFSAGSPKRPGYQGILSDLEHGRAEWDVLVVRHIDRVSRSLVDSLDLLTLLQQNGKGLISTTQALDLSTPTGRAMLHIILVFAQWEREINSERTKMKMVNIARQGLWPSGNPPLGYKRAGKGDNKLVIDPVNAERVRTIYRDYLAGIGPLEIVRKTGISKSVLFKVLHSKIYLGLMVYDGKEYKGQHDPLVSLADWEKVQEVLPKKRSAPRVRRQKHSYLLTGLVFCECGHRMTPQSCHGRSEIYHYYRCTNEKECSGRTQAIDLEERVVKAIRHVTITDKDADNLIEETKRNIKSRIDTQEIAQLKTAIDKVREEKNRIEELFLSGVVNKDNASIFNDKLTKVRMELNEMEGRRDALTAMANPDIQVLNAVNGWVSTLRILSKKVQASDDPVFLRKAINSYVKEIRRKGDDRQIAFRFASQGGSPKCTEWLPIEELGEPLLLLNLNKLWIAA